MTFYTAFSNKILKPGEKKKIKTLDRFSLKLELFLKSHVVVQSHRQASQTNDCWEQASKIPQNWPAADRHLLMHVHVI